MPMMYIPCESADANFFFALEKYAMDELSVADEYFLFWRTLPTLMIGRYQNTLAEINMPFARQNNIHIVRRITGGGTIYTDLNGWQFSFIVKNRPEGRVEFSEFTAPILAALRSIGVPAEASGRNDLVVDGKKISGNAQYVRKNLTLHHGSLLFDTDLETLVRALSPDNEKIVSKGLKSVRQRVTNIADYLPQAIPSEEFRDIMLTHLLKGLGTYTLSPSDFARIDELKRAQFDRREWNFGNDPKFNISRENHFAGGKLSVRTFVDKGRITDIGFYGDFFAAADPDTLAQALIGCEYEQQAVRRCLVTAQAQNYFYNITLDDILSCIL